MKNLKSVLLLCGMAVFMATACSDDEGQNVIPVDNGEQTSVKFSMDVSSLNMGGVSRAVNPDYTADQFTIYAFKKNDQDQFVCNKVISGSALSYSNKTLQGTVSIPIGEYKFLAAYGVKANLTNPLAVGTTLTDGLLLKQKANVLLPEVFLMTGGSDSQLRAADLEVYSMGLTDQSNKTVQATLYRAVSRVDIMFISATKSGNNYVEQPMARIDGKDILSGAGMDKLTLEFTGLNEGMNLFGTGITGTINSTYTFNLNPTGSDYGRVTIGSANATIIGGIDPETEAPYLKYDNVESADLILKSAHIGGPYLIPNASADASNVQLSMVATNTAGETRPIKIKDNGTLPLLQNYVTLVKIYVISTPDNPGENTIFDTNVTFEVELETEWLGSNEVSGELN